jgi:hypothetical protein
MMMFWPDGTRILKLRPLAYFLMLLNLSSLILRIASSEIYYFFGSGLIIFFYSFQLYSCF